MSEARIEIVISGDNAEAALEQIVAQLPQDATVVTPSDGQAIVAEAFNQALVAAGGLPSRVSDWWQAAQAGDGAGPVMALLLSVVVFAAVYGAERVIVALLARRSVGQAGSTLEYPKRFRAAMRWGFWQIVRLALYFVISRTVVAAVAGPGTTMAVLAPVLLTAVMRFRIMTTLVEFLAGASDASRRLTGLSGIEAGHVMRSAYLLLAVVAVLTFSREFIVSAVDAGQSGVLFAIIIRSTEGLLALAFFFAIRKPVARLIGAAFAPLAKPGSMTAIIINYWYVLYAFLLFLTVVSDSYGYLFPEIANASAASTYSFQIFTLTPFLMAGLKIWRDGRAAKAPDEQRGMVAGVFALLEGAVLLLAAVLVLLAWNIDPFATDAAGAKRIIPSIVSAALVIVLGISVWRTISAFLDVYAPETEEEADPSVPGGEAGRSGSRIETIFPILRIASVTLIATITIMLALAALGAQIGPLLAGAGVIGLAFGFGAQTLVKDIISGMFYLYEDAFRVGEYVETGEGKGSVEKILLRSVRLRHPRGAIFTIPFGSMGTIKNNSRDWVTMKFFFEVAPTEDLEKLRKLVKKVGAELAKDPDIGEQFIEPLKSQGAVAMVGPNFQIGVKFTCHPGEQFLIRRKAFAAIQKAINDHGIKVSIPRVVVDSPGDPAAVAAAATAIQKPPPATS